MKKILLSILLCLPVWASNCPEEPKHGQKLYENVSRDILSKKGEMEAFFCECCEDCNNKTFLARSVHPDEFSYAFVVSNDNFVASILVDEIGSTCLVSVDVLNEFDLSLFMLYIDCYFQNSEDFDTTED